LMLGIVRRRAVLEALTERSEADLTYAFFSRRDYPDR
jgi:hypothetical protein